MSFSNPARRHKWQPMPPPTPKILNLPRRPRRRPSRMSVAVARPLHSSSGRLHPGGDYYYNRGKFETPFDRERAFSKTVPVLLYDPSEERERVGDDGRTRAAGAGSGCRFDEEKWRFQTEILRAECNTLRMEREFTLKKMERNRARMEMALRSAIQTLHSGRKRLNEGEDVNATLGENIEDLAEKLEELHKSSKSKSLKVRSCSNFDKRASLLQRRLDKLGGLADDKSEEQQSSELVESRTPIRPGHELTDVEVLKRKMEGMSTGVFGAVMEEEYETMFSSTANSSASTSKQMAAPESCSFSEQPPYQVQESATNLDNKCSGRCKSIVRRIAEQVRAETEQWSQMQAMLGKVRMEMQELEASRDFWEDQALKSGDQARSLHDSVEEWKQRALTIETEAKELQNEVSGLKEEIEALRTAREMPTTSLGKQLEKEMQGSVRETQFAATNDKRRCKKERDAAKQGKEQREPRPISLGKQIEMEKHVMYCHRKESQNGDCRRDGHGCRRQRSPAQAQGRGSGLVALKRFPFREIGNTSPLVRQRSKAVFPLHSPKGGSTAEECF